MSIATLLLNEALSNLNHNIKVYERMSEYSITDVDRQKTLFDLRKDKKKLEKDIELLKTKP